MGICLLCDNKQFLVRCLSVDTLLKLQAYTVCCIDNSRVPSNQGYIHVHYNTAKVNERWGGGGGEGEREREREVNAHSLFSSVSIWFSFSISSAIFWL